MPELSGYVGWALLVHPPFRFRERCIPQTNNDQRYLFC
jgi:hypothetical protein